MVRTPRGLHGGRGAALLSRRRSAALQESVFQKSQGYAPLSRFAGLQPMISTYIVWKGGWGRGVCRFASPERMERYLGLRPGSVSPFGLINDTHNHVHLFLDRALAAKPVLSFHPNDNRATVVIAREQFERYLAAVGIVTSI